MSTQTIEQGEREYVKRAIKVQYQMARDFLAHARKAESPTLRAEFVRMVNVCRQLVKRNRMMFPRGV
jgi:hypothetical protein